MTEIIEIETDRLLLRQWRLTDFNLFAQLNSNNNVMKFFPDTLTRKESDELAYNIQQRIFGNGWGFWAVELPKICEFIGFVGLNKPSYKLPFSLENQIIEIGWRLSDAYWGKGFATEAAQSALTIGFSQLGFSEIVSFTSVLNLGSINVMERLNMKDTNHIFNHPKIPHGHKLQKHCLYKISHENWSKQNLY